MTIAHRMAREESELPPVSKAALIRLWAHLKPSIPMGLIASVVMVAAAAAAFPLPLLSREIIDRAIPQADRGLVVSLAVAVASLSAFSALTGLLHQYLLILFRQKVGLSMRTEVLGRVLSLPQSFFESEDTGYLMARAGFDSAQAEHLVTSQIPGYAADAVKLAACTAVLAWLDWRLTLVAAAAVPLYGVSVLLFRKRARRAGNEMSESWGKYFKDLQEAFSGVALVKSFGMTGRVLLNLASRIADVFARERASAMIGSGSSAVIGLTTMTATTAVTALGALAIMDGRLTVGGLLAFLMYLGYVLGPARSLSNLPVQIQPSLVAVRRISALFAVEPERSGGVSPGRIDGAVSFSGVSFSYDGSRDAVSGLSFEIAKGERVGIAGVTGCGKTTALKLMMGFIDPDKGEVTLDGRPMREYDPGGVRGKMGYLSQEVFFFSDTIEVNLRFAAPDVDAARIERALRLAGAFEFVDALPLKLATPIGERGQKLSGGERQRIAIARALLSNPDMLVMDEGTSDLDEATEAAVMGNLLEEFKGRTVIVVSHRPSVISMMERVIRMSGGKIED